MNAIQVLVRGFVLLLTCVSLVDAARSDEVEDDGKLRIICFGRTPTTWSSRMEVRPPNGLI